MSVPRQLTSAPLRREGEQPYHTPPVPSIPRAGAIHHSGSPKVGYHAQTGPRFRSHYPHLAQFGRPGELSRLARSCQFSHWFSGAAWPSSLRCTARQILARQRNFTTWTVLRPPLLARSMYSPAATPSAAPALGIDCRVLLKYTIWITLQLVSHRLHAPSAGLTPRALLSASYALPRLFPTCSQHLDSLPVPPDGLGTAVTRCLGFLEQALSTCMPRVITQP